MMSNLRAAIEDFLDAFFCIPIAISVKGDALYFLKLIKHLITSKQDRGYLILLFTPPVIAYLRIIHEICNYRRDFLLSLYRKVYMIFKFFFQKVCPYCPAAKKAVEPLRDKYEVEDYDVSTPEGLAEASLYGIFTTPALLAIKEEKVEFLKDVDAKNLERYLNAG